MGSLRLRKDISFHLQKWPEVDKQRAAVAAEDLTLNCFSVKPRVIQSLPSSFSCCERQAWKERKHGPSQLATRQSTTIFVSRDFQKVLTRQQDSLSFAGQTSRQITLVNPIPTTKQRKWGCCYNAYGEGRFRNQCS